MAARAGVVASDGRMFNAPDGRFDYFRGSCGHTHDTRGNPARGRADLLAFLRC
jgi:hypothetical protein